MKQNAPQKPENRPGLSQLTYRITDYTASRKWLLSLLRDSLRPELVNQTGPLFRLTTRDSDDTAIALLDAWSVLADVLTFYQERIANEGYLRTATERRSVLELARMIGYELDPGVAASTYFAFTVEDAPGSPEIAIIPKGTQVVSIPGEDELPQTFETSEEFIARVDWNNLRPRSSRPQQIKSETQQLYIKGVNVQLQPGDFLLLVDDISDGVQCLLQLKNVEINNRDEYTLVYWEESNIRPKITKPLQNPQLFTFRQRAFLYGHNAPGIVKINLEDPNNANNSLVKNIEWEKIQDWLNPDLQPGSSPEQIDLDALYPKILEKQWFVLFDAQSTNGLKIDKVKSTSLESKVENILLIENEHLAQITQVTRIILNSPIDRSKFGIRSTIILAQSEALELVREPLVVSDRQTDIFQDPIQGKTIFLNEFVPKLRRDQILIVSGQLIRAQLNNIGGVYQKSHKSSDTERQQEEKFAWARMNQGLINTQVRSLAASADGNTMLAGTTEGIFRFKESEQYWEPIIGWNIENQALEVKDIQALVLDESNHRIFVGTAEGLFYSDDDGQQWQKQDSSAGLTYTDIRTIYLHPNKQVLAGTVNGGLFRSDNQGEAWRATRLNHTDVQSLTSQSVDDAVYTLAGTIRDGIFLCKDPELLIWQQITDTRQGIGTITTNGAEVVSQDTRFSTQLKLGDVINAGEQSRTVLGITVDPDDSNQERLTVDRPFRPDLTANTSFTINTGLTNRNVTALAAKEGLILAGTAGSGVFRSEDHGDRWVAVNTGLTDLEVRCLVIDEDGNIWIGTSKAGVFHSTNNGDSWEETNTDLTNLDVRAILPSKTDNTFYVGGIGILRPPEGSYPKPVCRGDILQVLEPPAPVPNKPEYHSWQLMDKDGFQGELITITPLENPQFMQDEVILLPALEDSEVVSELAVIQNPPTDQQRPILTLQNPLKAAYDPVTVKIYANVVPGTHGETVEEVLGSGDGHLPNQRFGLRKPPLTYVSAANARGSESSLAVRVNGVLWQEAASLYPLKPHSQNYIIRIQDDGTTTVTFGDGTKGARLPSGLENITATYRSGIGLEGNLKAEQLSLLKTRPLGISEVTNPLPATGGAPRESLAEARQNAPATVRTLDRIVSIRDFEDFAQGFAGIGKAQAVPLWNGETQIVHITIAGVQGNDVPKDSNLYTKLVEAIDQARDPIQQVQVDAYEQLLFNLEARLLLDSRYEAKVVSEQIYQTLNSTFAFERRKFGQEVTASEVIAAVQSVAGVIAVDLDALYQVGRSKARERSLPALAARYDVQTDAIHPAQLLRLNPAGIQLAIVPTL